MNHKTIGQLSNETTKTGCQENTLQLPVSSLVNEMRAQVNFLVSGRNRNFNTLIFLLAVNLPVAALGFATRIKIANVLGAVDFGILSYGLAIATYIETIVRYGTDKTLVRDIVHQQEKTSEILVSTFIFKLLLFFFCLGLLLTYELYTGQKESSELVLWVVIGSSLTAFEAKGAYDATNNMRRHTLYFAGFRAIFFCFIWIYIFTNVNRFTVEYVGIATTVAASIYIFVQYKWVLTRYWQKSKFTAIYHGMVDLFYKNFPICFAALCALGLIAFNQVILKKYCGAQELGIYAAAWQFFWVGSLFVLQLARVGQPILARKLQADDRSKESLPLFILKYVVVMLVTVLPISLPIIIFPELIISYFFNQGYIESIAPLRIIGLYMMIFSVDVVFTQYIVTSRKNKLYMVVVSFFGAISMLFSWLIIPRYQATGAAISLVASHSLATFVLAFFVVQDLFKTKNPPLHDL